MVARSKFFYKPNSVTCASDWPDRMDKHDARRIAETANALRPDWPIGSLMTLLAEHRNKDALDVHLAAVWIAYDDTIESPAILRAEGPWWKLRRSTTLGAPTLPAFRPPDDTTPASPDVIAACRAKLRGKDQPHD